MSREPHLWEYLRQDEWRLAFATAFVDMTEFGDSIDLKPFHVPGYEDTWESAIIAAVRFLVMELDVEFEAVHVREDDFELLVTRTDPVEPGNLIYLPLMAKGKLPHVALALEAAIRLLHERAPSFNAEPFEEALNAVNEARERALKDTDPKALAETEKLMDAALASIGVVRLGKAELIH